MAHTEADVMAEHNRLKAKFPHVELYPSRQRLVEQYLSYTKSLQGRTILDYGCGRGDMALRYLKAGAARVCAIDISRVYVDDAQRRARDAGFGEDRAEFAVMDAHLMTFPDESFDLVAGWSILHHLDSQVAMKEIHRVLKPGGRVLLWEPLLDHPLMKLFRSLTPKARTEDELPFSGSAIKQLLSQRTWRAEMGYCGVLEAPVAVLTSLILPRHADNPLIRLADRAESWMHDQGWLLSWNQHVLFNLVKT